MLLDLKVKARALKTTPVCDLFPAIDEVVGVSGKLEDVLTGAPAVPASPIPPSKMDSASKIVTALLAICIGGAAVASLTLKQPQPENPNMDGLKALRAGEWVKAEHHFTKAGDRHRLAEVFLLQDRDTDAMQALDGLHDGRAEYLRGVAALKRGDEPAARSLFAVASSLGEIRAAQYLEKLGEG